jgi:hypothetical protein
MRKELHLVQLLQVEKRVVQAVAPVYWLALVQRELATHMPAIHQYLAFAKCDVDSEMLLFYKFG